MGGGVYSGWGTGRLWALVAALCAVATLLWAVPATAAGTEISGRVTNTSAQPLEGIEVCALVDGPFGSSECTGTDSNGEYSIPGFGAGALVHFFTRENAAPGYAPQWYPGKQFFEEAEGVAAADVSHVDAQLSRGGTVAGTVRSTQGSTPIEGVQVCPVPVIFRDREVTWCDKTDASGEFALRGLSTAEYRFEFNTAGDVNYVEALTSPHLVQAGTEAILEAHLVPGVKVEGTITDAGTGLPVEGLAPPYSAPTICALDSATEERIKCTAVGIGGHYKLPGLPPGKTFGVAFAVDGVEEGRDLNPDGYVRQYWDHVPTWEEATVIFGSGGSTHPGVDAVLSRGAEVFPHCEVASACPPPESGGGVIPSSPAQPFPTAPPLLSRPEVHCKKGYLKVERIGHTRCVKIHKKKPKRHKHPRHHRQTSGRNR